MLKTSYILLFSFIVYFTSTECREVSPQDQCYPLVKPLLDLMAASQGRDSGESVTKTVPQNFQKIGSRYFYFEEIHKKNWYAAGNSCRRMGGTLASIQSEEEFTAIKQHPKRISNEHYWLDINNLGDEGHYMSSTTGQIAPFLKWAWTEPNNLYGVEHCIDLYVEHMYDNNCAKNYYFICQANN